MRPRVILTSFVTATLVGSACGTSDTPPPRSEEVSVEVEAEAGTPDGEWTLVAMGPAGSPEPVAAEAPITLTIEGTTLSGSAGCNRYSAEIDHDGERIAIGPIAATRMACPEPAMGQEMEYLSILGDATRYAVAGDRLRLHDDVDDRVAVFEASR